MPSSPNHRPVRLSNPEGKVTRVDMDQDRRTLIHECAFQWGGAERVFASMLRAAPGRPIATFVAGDPSVIRRNLPGLEFNILYPRIKTNAQFRAAVPLLSVGLPRQRPIGGAASLSSYAVSRWVPTSTPRLIYLHSPMRQLWHGRAEYERGRAPQAMALRLFGSWLRAVDLKATQAGDRVLVPSRRIAKLCNDVYGLSSTVVPPPVDERHFESPLKPDAGYFIWTGRIVEPIKRLSLLMQVFDSLPNHRLIVVGDGRSAPLLRKTAPKNVTFLGWQHSEALSRLVASARAFILPSQEDFGVAAAESLALGVPLITTPLAGISEWVRNTPGGVVTEQDLGALTQAVVDARTLDRGEMVRDVAAAFREAAFAENLRREWDAHECQP